MNIKRIFERIFSAIFAKIKVIFKPSSLAILVKTEKEIDDLPIHSESILDPALTEREVFKYSLDPRAWSHFDETYLHFSIIVKDRRVLGMMNEMFKRKNMWIESRSYFDAIAYKKSANAFYDELDRVYSDHLSKELGARIRASVLYGHKPDMVIVKPIQGKQLAWSNQIFAWTQLTA